MYSLVVIQTKLETQLSYAKNKRAKKLTQTRRQCKHLGHFADALKVVRKMTKITPKIIHIHSKAASFLN